MLPGAMVKADRNHGAGMGSPGTVMGSKKLKAIAVRGTGRVPLATPTAFMDTVAAWEKVILASPQYSQYNLLHDAGIIRNYGTGLGDTYWVAFKNLTDPEAGRKFGQHLVEACARWRVTPQPSYNCQIRCAYDLEMTSGPFAGYRVSLCGGAANIDGAATVIGVDDPAAALVMAEYYDDMGLEASVFGGILGMVFEAYNRGWLTTADTDGLDLTWGNWQAAMALIEKAIRREGVGAKLATGLKEAAALLGEPSGLAADFRDITVHIKGDGIVMHDWRPFQGALFSLLVAGCGPAHFGHGSDHRPIAEAGYPVPTPGVADTFEETFAKVKTLPSSQFYKMWWDNLGICWFTCGGIPGTPALTAEALGHAVGWNDFSVADAVAVGERTVNALRLIYQKRGFTKRDECDYGQRYLEPAPAGPAQGKTIASWVPAMVDEYYRQMGWDVATGYVRPERLPHLKLEEFAA
ncbi:MAG: hypothetical protein HYU88_08500 [Chloroflexi bacterium]|nr:hypothetical protein [Chloroflexota bacterium]